MLPMFQKLSMLPRVPKYKIVPKKKRVPKKRVAKKKVIISFFISPLNNTTNNHKICLDNEGTIGEVYHNCYSKILIDNLLTFLENDF